MRVHQLSLPECGPGQRIFVIDGAQSSMDALAKLKSEGDQVIVLDSLGGSGLVETHLAVPSLEGIHCFGMGKTMPSFLMESFRVEAMMDWEESFKEPWQKPPFCNRPPALMSGKIRVRPETVKRRQTLLAAARAAI